MKNILNELFKQNVLIQILTVFGFISLFTALLSLHPQIVLGNADYWQNHGLAFLIFITLFPRLTLLFSSVLSGGIFWWLGWIFAPRILVAFLATISYWQQNPILVMISWFVALIGESTEKYYVGPGGGRIRTVFIRRSPSTQYYTQTADGRRTEFVDENTIEADFKRID
ncbi:MAG: hypothetical protein H6622_07575 [Halobacteriovoraceae bacterium]|nr:hypothetical protein [Halobacteriovoraceae bacterium]